jgi:hypothetical protein
MMNEVREQPSEVMDGSDRGRFGSIFLAFDWK